jgi:hypothetical protein
MRADYLTRAELLVLRDRARRQRFNLADADGSMRRKFERLEAAADELIGALTDEEDVS